MTQSSGVSFDASTDIFRPLIFRLGMFAPLPVYEAAYGGNSLSWVLAGIHRVYMPGSGSMIRNRFRGNAIWNEYRNRGCALRQGFVMGQSSARAAGASSVSAFPNGERIALG
jgi:hypothetical protein